MLGSPFLFCAVFPLVFLNDTGPLKLLVSQYEVCDLRLSFLFMVDGGLTFL